MTTKQYTGRGIVLILTVLLLVMLTACEEALTPEQQEYKDLCSQTNGMWMKMSELKDGKPVGPSCYGCMTDESNHYCTKEEYEAVL